MKKIYIVPASYSIDCESLDCTMALYSVAKTTDAVTDRPGSDEDINVHNTTGDDVDPDAKVMDFDMWDDFDNWDLWS